VTTELRISELPSLERPILISAFRGWNDGGQGASIAAGYLARLWKAERFADIDPEGFFDFQATRPQVALEDGVTRKIEWPENEFLYARATDLRRDVVLMLGVEPNLRWRTFSGLVADLAQRLHVDLVVSLGALLADVPHTRPSPVSGAASNAELVEQLKLEQSRYEGPTGIVGVLHDALREVGIPSLSLWAAVPHYVSMTPSPRAALALCERLADLLGGTLDLGELAEASDSYVRQVSDAVSSDAETMHYVEELEARTDAYEVDIPTGDALAAELSRFLREREQDEPGDGPAGSQPGGPPA
jgi:proteasome assembly chaperone (PAC2) family protein